MHGECLTQSLCVLNEPDTFNFANDRQSELEYNNKYLEAKNREYKKRYMEKDKELLRKSGQVPTLQAKIQGLERNIKRAESDVKFKTEEAAKYQSQLYTLEIELEGVTTRLGEEILALKDRLKLVESERDALKTSLKEEEVLRIAAEGQIALPTATHDEEDEFASPVRSPRKPRNVQHDDEDKENQSPRKSAIDLRFLQQELAAERRYRAHAEDQIEFMKMECQFQCCSCRIAENKSKVYVHDDSYAAQMEAIKASVPALTPPGSDNGDDAMEIVKDGSVDGKRPFTPPPEEQASETLVAIHQQSEEPEAVIAFSPTTGTFKSIPSPVKAPPKRSLYRQSARESTQSTARYSDVRRETTPLEAPFEYVQEPAMSEDFSVEEESKNVDIAIHEDTFDDSDEEMEPPISAAEGPSTPYVTKTTTTTIPIAFSPATPAPRPGKQLMSPFTVAHHAPVLGELALNNVPFDREAALQAIRERRGRARSMAEGHGTPMKQMLDGVKERRDISAPVSRIGRR